jgi:hypothetical protein
MTTPLRHADIDDAIPASGAQLADRSKTNALLKRMAFHAPEAAAAVERSVQERLGDLAYFQTMIPSSMSRTAGI